MFSGKLIRDTIKEYIDKGVIRFAIYPFGANGMVVRNYMEECFDISPETIVDNVYSQYNPKFINLDRLRQIYDTELYIILTAEDKELNQKLMEELLSFVPRERIVNLIDPIIREEKQREEIEASRKPGDKFSLENILPQGKVILRNKSSEDRIRVRFLQREYHTWNNLRTICEQFEMDSRYDVKVVCYGYVDNKIYLNRLIKQMEKERHQYVIGNQYCAKEDQPDILIIGGVGLSECKRPREIREYTSLIIAVPMLIKRCKYSIEEEFFTLLHFEKYQPDYYLIDSLLFNEIKMSFIYSDKFVEMGNPKYDEIFYACRQKNYPSGWDKLKGRRTVLWATTHGLHGKFNMTFDLYSKCIFQYASQHTDMGVVLRLHPAFIKELLEFGIWSEDDLAEIKEYCEKTPNIVWDETDTYESAYSVADAILTDESCGITVSALPTLKPVCIMYRNDRKVKPLYPDLDEYYYSVYSEKDLTDFFDMVRGGADPMLEQRREIIPKCVKHFDGRNGERIKDFIVQAYEAKVKEAL